MIVIDASALVEVLIGGTPRAAKVALRLRGETLHAPHLVDLETTSVLRAMEARGLATPIAAQALADLVALAITRYPHDTLVHRMWQLRGNLTVYDACYVALAESLSVPLVTCDGRLASAPGNRATIELIA
jgi:predicted nucleic acid-binding protein